MKLQLINLWILAVSGFCLIAQEKDEKLSDPIDVTDEKAIEAAVGKSVMIKGKVGALIVPQTADIRIWFSDSLFRLFIKSDVFDSKENWRIDESIGKDVFVRGKIVKNGGFTQISSRIPNNGVKTNQTLLLQIPKLIIPVKKVNKLMNQYHQEQFFQLNQELENSILLSLKRVLRLFWECTPEVPKMVISEVRAELIESEESGPMQATFESKPKLNTKPMVSVMTYLPRKHFAQGWPLTRTCILLSTRFRLTVHRLISQLLF